MAAFPWECSFFIIDKEDGGSSHNVMTVTMSTNSFSKKGGNSNE
ncbi:hypothetical protein JOC48_002680 [Aquibacillus albus]|uniref:Uncharacterized protein n=1 Tax=Aquibacillus albus TaxID=1168171 RepID=A0ABS2N227_9BACI|nr:hypothetical protein [Aquibacillus albus]